MLQKEFFNVEPFNPYPYFDNTVLLNLSGGEQYEDNTVFPIGKYEIIVRAGGVRTISSSNQVSIYCGTTIDKVINITSPFVVRGYCGSETISNQSAQSVVLGTNPYSGVYKVNGVGNPSVSIPDVNHIFGNAGSAGTGKISMLTIYLASSGNCLGNGAKDTQASFTMFQLSGAGSCLHLMPIDGIFGVDYFYAFHVSGTAIGGGGSGSAYGGGASGRGSNYNGGNSPYGIGGAAGSVARDGTGIGHGNADGSSAGAFFDGISWNTISNITGNESDGMIKIIYLGPLD